jgi:hypothetical protein
MPLDAAIGQVFTTYYPIRRLGHQCWHKKLCCDTVKLLSKSKTQTVLSNQLIKTTSCTEWSDAIIGAEYLSYYLSSYQMLSIDQNC